MGITRGRRGSRRRILHSSRRFEWVQGSPCVRVVTAVLELVVAADTSDAEWAGGGLVGLPVAELTALGEWAHDGQELLEEVTAARALGV